MSPTVSSTIRLPSWTETLPGPLLSPTRVWRNLYVQFYKCQWWPLFIFVFVVTFGRLFLLFPSFFEVVQVSSFFSLRFSDAFPFIFLFFSYLCHRGCSTISVTTGCPHHSPVLAAGGPSVVGSVLRPGKSSRGLPSLVVEENRAPWPKHLLLKRCLGPPPTPDQSPTLRR